MQNSFANRQETALNKPIGRHFESIESAHEFIRLLSETLIEIKKEIEVDTEKALGSQAPRRVQALQAVSYNLEKLAVHMKKSRRILNDLRTLRRLLCQRTECGRVEGLQLPTDGRWE